MLFECKNCGAPLEVGQRSHVRCAYCRAEQTIQRTELRPTPQGWVQPPRWVPPTYLSVGQKPLVYRRQFGGVELVHFIVPVVVIGFFVLLAVAEFIFVRSKPSKPTSRTSNPAATAPTRAWDGATTLDCNAAMRIADVGVDIRANPGIRLWKGCRLTLDRVQLKGSNLIAMVEDSTLEVNSSRLSGSGLIRSDGARSIALVSTTLDGEDLLVVNGNTSVEIRSSNLVVRGTRGIDAEGSGRVDLRDTEIGVHAKGQGVTAVRVAGSRRSKMDRIKVVAHADRPAPLKVFATAGSANINLWQPTITLGEGSTPPSELLLFEGRSSRSSSVAGGTVQTGALPIVVEGKVGVRNMNYGGSRLVERP